MSDIDKEKQELKVVSDFIRDLTEVIPNLVKGVISGLFSEQAGADIGKAVGGFYKSLIEAGVPQDKALAMTHEYLGTLTKWSDILKSLQDAKLGPHAEVKAKRGSEEAEGEAEETEE